MAAELWIHPDFKDLNLGKTDFINLCKKIWDAKQSDAVEFADWIRKNYQPKSINKCWVSNKSNSSYPEYTTEQLCEQFKKR